MVFSNVILVLTALFTGLVAGLLFSYACSVNPGLAQVPDVDYIRAMQSINRAIVNPVFLLAFIGTVLSLLTSCYLQFGAPRGKVFWYIAAATVIYLAGVVAVTAFGNIPLNNQLAKFDFQAASAENVHLQRLSFATKWNGLHLIRTAASIISFFLVVLSCVSTQPSAQTQ